MNHLQRPGAAPGNTSPIPPPAQAVAVPVTITGADTVSHTDLCDRSIPIVVAPVPDTAGNTDATDVPPSSEVSDDDGPSAQPRMWRRDQVAEQFNVTTRTVDNWLRRRLLRKVVIGRTVRIPEEDILALLGAGGAS